MKNQFVNLDEAESEKIKAALMAELTRLYGNQIAPTIDYKHAEGVFTVNYNDKRGAICEVSDSLDHAIYTLNGGSWGGALENNHE